MTEEVIGNGDNHKISKVPDPRTDCGVGYIERLEKILIDLQWGKCEEETKLANQLMGKVMPIRQVSRSEKARKITADEKKYNAFVVLRQARANKRLAGYREKKAREKAQEDIPSAKGAAKGGKKK